MMLAGFSTSVALNFILLAQIVIFGNKGSESGKGQEKKGMKKKGNEKKKSKKI